MMKVIKLGLFISLLTVSLTGHCFVVLIDPGHGGKELGAKSHVHGHSILEKDLSLRLSKKLKKYLEKKYTTYLTRSYDRHVSLQDRANLADDVKADLFVSIHFNSDHDKRSNGFELFYLDNHDQAATKKVEQTENFEMIDDNKEINQILLDLIISKTVESSKKLASHIHKSVTARVTRKYRIRDRGIKPGLFYVLALSKRPGVLVEAGFLSNPQEAKKMMKGTIIDAYAKSIARGIDQYFKSKIPDDVNLF
jgi:N-acetylmuramoyl-L-alanine amidase